MMQPKMIAFVATMVLAGMGVLDSAGTTLTATGTPQTWNPRTAAAYLDQRQSWWESWPRSARDHGTVCISCHTAVPYALARPELRAILHENEPTPLERKLVADVTTRVRDWSQVRPFYGNDSTPKGVTKQ